ncbi:MAG: UDP-N-acetylmuramoyl-tripeptide--D-alanyl-D-alanine ligase [Solirubrobacteraceae bacterium]|nr:UDP-N-acetylmuramoyl-tripeptide--D-alanyl-D-alanine ligase [Solirubrobacteraceae bacterium]
MIDRTAGWVATAAGARLHAGDPHEPGPRRAVVDSRAAAAGDLFVGLRGTRDDGGRFAAQALAAGAWGAIVSPDHADDAARTGRPAIVADDPLAALQSLAREWRRELGAPVIAVTGSTGKTSTKDILAALLRGQWPRTHANRENLNTEIGLPLTILEAERGTKAMVLEMAMRGAGQIAELTAIAEPDVGVVVNVGPVHLELLGTIERVAAAKAELIRDLRPGAAYVVPAGEPLLEPHLRDDLETITFGEGGDVRLVSFEDGVARIDARGTEVVLELSYDEAYNVLNTVAAVAAARALGVVPAGRVDVGFSSLRGEVVELGGGVTVVYDFYNANPKSMNAAHEHHARSPAERRIAVLGTMAELGADGERFHREVGRHADELGVDVLVTVGEAALPFGSDFDGEKHAVASPEEARAILEELAQPGDRVLIKGSRSAGLERVVGAD